MLSQLRQAASSAAAENPGELTSFGHWSAAYMRGVYPQPSGEYFVVGHAFPGGPETLLDRLDRTSTQKRIYMNLLHALEHNPELRVGDACARQVCSIFEDPGWDSDDVSSMWAEVVL
jgi:hypothetical protein